MNEPTTGTIYVLKNTVNGKCYVGQTKHPVSKRVYFHSKHKQSLAGRAIRKYGIDAFDIHYVNGVPMHLIDWFEIAMIRQCGSVVPNGYNLHLGGQKNRQISDATRAKISASKRGKPSTNKGKTMSEDAKRKMSASLKGRTVWNKGIAMRQESREKLSASKTGTKLSEETKAKMSASAKLVEHTDEWNRKVGDAQKGKVISQATRDKISASLRGTTQSDERKKKHGEIMTEWWKKRKEAQA